MNFDQLNQRARVLRTRVLLLVAVMVLLATVGLYGVFHGPAIVWLLATGIGSVLSPIVFLVIVSQADARDAADRIGDSAAQG